MRNDQTRGLYRKFKVERTDGKSAPGEKHDGCEYFVLDMDHDKHAHAAIVAYVQSLENTGEYPGLAADLRDRYLLIEGSKMTITPEKKARLVAAAAEFDAAMEAIYGPRISTEGGDVDPSPEAFAIAVQAEIWTHFSANQRTINKAKIIQAELNRAAANAAA